MDSKNCGDALQAYPVNQTFACCFHTQDGGSSVSGEIRQGSKDDWIATDDYFKTAGIICIVLGGLCLLCLIGGVLRAVLGPKEAIVQSESDTSFTSSAESTADYMKLESP